MTEEKLTNQQLNEAYEEIQEIENKLSIVLQGSDPKLATLALANIMVAIWLTHIPDTQSKVEACKVIVELLEKRLSKAIQQEVMESLGSYGEGIKV